MLTYKMSSSDPNACSDGTVIDDIKFLPIQGHFEKCAWSIGLQII
jgi:hypothetical protein